MHFCHRCWLKESCDSYEPAPKQQRTLALSHAGPSCAGSVVTHTDGALALKRAMTSKTAGGPFHLILQPHTADLSARIKALTNLTPNVENFPIKGSKTHGRVETARQVLFRTQLTEADFVLSIAAAGCRTVARVSTRRRRRSAR